MLSDVEPAGAASTPPARTPPVWARAGFVVVCGVVGLLLVTRRYESATGLIVLVAIGLAVLGADRLLSARPWPPAALASAAVCLLAAAVLAVGSNGRLDLMAALVGLVLLIQGAIRVAAALLRRGPMRPAGLLLGASLMILGAVALVWPDLTVLGTPFVLGGWLLVTAVRRAWSLRGRPAPAVPLVVPVIALTVAVLLAVGTIAVRASIPEPDAFYDRPPSAPATPGQLLRSAEYTPAPVPGARSWRILYTTTRADGQPAIASGVVVVPDAPASAPRPVVAWAHGTTGFAVHCAPSLQPDTFSTSLVPALARVLGRGWAVVATDYTGLGTGGPHPYLIGEGEGRSVLDAVRAARQLTEAGLSQRTVVWGHSQGGNAALWSGVLAPTYAPHAGLVGVAALAPGSNVPALLSDLEVLRGGNLFTAYLLAAYSRVYPDVDFDAAVDPLAQVPLREMATRCLSGPEAYVSRVDSRLLPRSVLRDGRADPALARRVAQNVPTGQIQVPVLIAQGLLDSMVLPPAQRSYVEQLCSTGSTVDYRTYAGLDHVGLVADGSPALDDLISWTQDRFDGKPAPSDC